MRVDDVSISIPANLHGIVLRRLLPFVSRKRVVLVVVAARERVSLESEKL